MLDPTMTVLPGTEAAIPAFHLVRSESKDLSLDLAKWFKALPVSPTDRPIVKKRVEHLQAKIKAGLGVTFHWAIAILHGVEYRMNGGHSSTMLCGLNGDFPKGLKAHIDTYEVSSLEGLALLFRQFDDRRSSRSPGDVSGAYQGLYEPIRGIDRTFAKLALEGVNFFERNVEGLPIPRGDDQFSRFSDDTLYPALHWMAGIFPNAPELQRIPVVAAMFATWQANEHESKVFWDDAVVGGLEDDVSPAVMYDNWLLAHDAGKLDYDLKTADFYKAAIYCWNVYRAGKQVDKVRYDFKNFPKISA